MTGELFAVLTAALQSNHCYPTSWMGKVRFGKVEKLVRLSHWQSMAEPDFKLMFVYIQSPYSRHPAPLPTQKGKNNY